MFLWKVLVLATALMAALSESEATSNMQEVELDQKSAKQVLVRHKRGFLGICWLWECEEEREENSERTRESNERHNESRRKRVCPTKCWNPWPTTWSACSHQCGGAGVRRQTRTIKSAAALGECKDYGNPVKCPGGYSRTQACNRFCRNGGTPHSRGCWCSVGYSGTCCETRITCSSCPTLRNGLATPSGCNFPSGTVVRFSCNAGYRLQGRSSSRCFTTGTWSYSFPTCRIITCSALPQPSHGRLVQVSGSGNSYGATMRTSCDNGYRMEGSSIRKCQANGRWSGAAPTCQLVYCPALSPPAHASIKYTNRNVGGEAVYTCLRGFVLQGYHSRRCQSDGTWTGLIPTCNAIMCRNLPTPVNGQVTHSSSSGGRIAFDAMATFTCNRGYIMQGPSSFTCGGSDIVGSFNGQPPRCVPVECNDPGNPDFGVRYGSNFQLGRTLTFHCGPGYFLQGETSVTCLDTGRWSHPKPVCKACPVNFYKPQMNNAKSCMPCPSHSSTGSLPGATVVTRCRCRRGYKGPYGGPCTLIRCPNLQAPVYGSIISCGNKLDETCIFTCDEGHVVAQGDTRRTCTDLETWTGGEVKCEPCPKDSYRATYAICLPCPANSGTTGAGNEKSGCLCQNGYQGPPGGPCSDTNECLVRNGGCEQTCENIPGSFRCECNNPGYAKDDTDFRKCVSENNCTDVKAPENGGSVCHFQRRTNTKRCQVKCNNGFQHLITPNGYEECGPSTGWKWSYELKEDFTAYYCIPLFFEKIQTGHKASYFTGNCTSLGTAEQRKIKTDFVIFLTKKGVCSLGNQQICLIEDVEIECKGTSRRTKRNADPDLKIRFTIRSKDKRLPTTHACNEACRKEITEKTRKEIEAQSQLVLEIFSKTNANNQNVTLGGVLMTQTSKVIILSPPTPSCGRGKTHRNHTCVPVFCGLPKPPNLGSVNVSGHLYGDIATFQCPPNLVLVGDRSTTCTAEGTWSPHSTTCMTHLPTCRPLLPPAHGNYYITGSSYGDTVTFYCWSNYKLFGDRTTECGSDGNWKPHNTRCIYFGDLQYDCINNNPCRPLRLLDRLHYRHRDADKYVHCYAGICMVKSCPTNLEWNNDRLLCT